MLVMAENGDRHPATHFGRQMRKERLARGWSLREFSARSGINFGNASRIENGHRPPNEKVALACDRVFPERQGWFLEYYEDSKSWVPAGFRNWAEYEERAERLYDWYPSIITGLLQTEDYARAILSASGASPDVISSRLAARMERQRRVLLHDDPPKAWFVVDEVALFRYVGSTETMAGQMAHLADVARLPSMTLSVMPAVAHPANESGFILADDVAAFAEHVAAGGVYTDDQTVSTLVTRFDILRGESYRVSESLARIERMKETWSHGASQATAAPTADSALRLRRPTK